MKSLTTTENSSSIDYEKVEKALNAEIPIMSLNAEEQAVYFEKFYDSMWETTPEQEQAFQDYIEKH